MHGLKKKREEKKETVQRTQTLHCLLRYEIVIAAVFGRTKGINLMWFSQRKMSIELQLGRKYYGKHRGVFFIDQFGPLTFYFF